MERKDVLVIEMIVSLDYAQLLRGGSTLPRTRIYNEWIPSGAGQWMEAAIGFVGVAIDEKLEWSLDPVRLGQPVVRLIKVLLEDFAARTEQRLCDRAKRCQGTDLNGGRAMLIGVRVSQSLSEIADFDDVIIR